MIVQGRKIGLIRLYCGSSGTPGYYHMQELGLARELSNRGMKPWIVLLRPDLKEIEEQELEEGIRLLLLPGKRIGSHGFFKLELLERFSFDLIQINGDNQLFTSHVIRYCRKRGIPVYSYIGTVDSDSKNPVKRAVMRALFFRNQAALRDSLVFAKTPYVEKKLKGLGAEKVFLAPVGLDLAEIPDGGDQGETLRRDLGFLPEDFLLLFVGRLEPYKNPQMALELLRMLDARYKLVMIGKGSLREELFRFVKIHGLEQRVCFIEAVKNEKIHEYYRISTAFLNFNDKEIFGMSILEAMYQGCPVIAWKAPGPDFIIENGKSGFVTESLEEMKERLKQVKPDMGKWARERVIKRFSWKTTCDIMLDQWKKAGFLE